MLSVSQTAKKSFHLNVRAREFRIIVGYQLHVLYPNVTTEILYSLSISSLSIRQALPLPELCLHTLTDPGMCHQTAEE